MDIVVDQIIAILKILAFRNAISRNENIYFPSLGYFKRAFFRAGEKWDRMPS